MIHTCYLVRYGLDVLAVIYRRNAGECAQLLQLDLCYGEDCPARRHGVPHAHVPGHIVREGQLPEIGSVAWGLTGDDTRGVVLCFVSQKLII